MDTVHALPDAQYEDNQGRREPASSAAAPPLRASRKWAEPDAEPRRAAQRSRGTGVARLVAQRLARRPWLLAGRRANRGRQTGEVAPAPALWFRTFRRWSPGMMPPLLGTLLLLLTGALATHHIGQSAPLVDAHTLLTLFLIYLICGTVYGLLLYLSAGATTWWIVLTSGMAGYLLATVFVIGGPLTGGFAAVLLAAAVGRYGHRHVQPIADGTVAVTAFAGGYHRTLRPGMAVLVPGERVLATLDTSERRITCPTQRISVRGERGVTYLAHASATVAFNIVPAEAHRAAVLGQRWEHELNDLVCAALQRALAQWSAAVLVATSEVPDRLLARETLQYLREEARARGVHIVWVSVRDIWLAPEGETLPVEEWDREEGDGAKREDDGEAPVATALPRRAPVPAPALPSPQLEDSMDETLEPEPEPEPKEEGVDATPAAAPTPEMSPEVLSDAYEAVREGRIHDPDTIRGIAQAFLRVANDPALNAEFPYDAVSAAKILRERAKRLDRELHGAQKPFDGN